MKTHPDWTLEIVGEGPEEALYRSLINEYELEKSIALHPFTKEVQEYYAHSSMYVLSSRWEGFGLVMIEAMAHGLPVIASDLPITRELLKDKDMAVLFETGNIAQLAGCMSYMADRTDWEWMGNKAVEYADTFHIEKVCDSVDQYNSLYGLETLNPLVSVIDLNKATRQMDYVHWNYGVYALYLKLEKACDIKYGRRSYDYQEGTVVCFAPGQTTETTLTTDRVQLNVLGILFHPDLLRGTTLGKTIKKYTFFSYEVSEALHLSEDERNIMTDCLKIIRMELERGVDKHSKTLLVNYIELLLNYCMRFYERQFATRSHSNRDVLTRFEGLLDDYFEGELAERDGLPTVKYFADKLCLSSNYFGDMFKKETGKTPQEYIQEKVIELAKERMSDRRETVSRVAYSLGFQYPQHFCRLFKKRVGCTPNEYRAQNLLL